MRTGVKGFTPAIRYWDPPALPAASTLSPTRTSAKASSFNPTHVLFLVIVCALLTGGLLFIGRARLAGFVFWGVLGLLLAREFTSGRSLNALGLLIGTAPFVNLLRGFAFYNIIIFLFAIALIYHFVRQPGEMKLIWRKASLLKPMFVCIAAFYAVSLFNTHDYSVNLRLFELAFTLLAILILGQDIAALGTALTGTLISAWVVGFSLLAQISSSSVTRLGVIVMDGQVLGNPTQLGMPLAFGFLALIIDRGYWMNLQHRPVLRHCMLVPTLPLLALTTSRSSWLVAAGGIAVTLLAGRKQRIKMLLIIAVGLLAFQAVLISPYGKSLKKGLDRTFSDTRTTAQRTSGRSDQWRVSYHAFMESPLTMLIGHGPGKGAEVYADYSHDVGGVKYAVGKKVALHSLFMQIAVETGCLGLFLLGCWLFLALAGIIRRTVLHGAILPLACFFGYVFVVITVSGNDINSGILLGLALLGTILVPVQAAKQQTSRVPLRRFPLAAPLVRVSS